MSVVAMFAKVDTSGDGGVTREELVKNCHLLNLSVEEAHRLFDKLDVNGDGEVSAEEFTKAVVEIENNDLNVGGFEHGGWQERRCENGPPEPCWDCVHKPLHMCNHP